MKTRFFPKDNYIQEDVDFFVEKGYSMTFAKILSTRGVTAQSLQSFCEFSLDSFFDPFLMQGMGQAVAQLQKAFEKGSSILIFGDYDADGLSASALLSLFFTHNGIDNDVIIPTRADGYGMNVDKIFQAFSTKHYDIILTVDCGISNLSEVQQLKEKFGDSVTVIVTDHHEPPECLPDCICVNPKLSYPFKYLSGSGVAFKLVQALSGIETAKQYADLAVIGTIADVMPLTSENRDLVILGLANFNHKGLKMLAEASKCGKEISATDIAMRISPKINAAGRMGDPYIALQLLLQSEKADKESVAELLQTNEQRRTDTDTAYNKAICMLNLAELRSQRLIFVCGDWNHGLSGILANRLCQEFNLPAIVMTQAEGKIVGSARCNDGIDLFALLQKNSNLLVSFGGHTASGGFSIEQQNLDAFKNSLIADLQQLDSDKFVCKSYYDMELDGEVTVSDIFEFSKLLEPLQPNQNIVVRIKDFVKYANTFGTNSAHLSVVLNSGLELKAFYRLTNILEALKTGAEIDVLVTLSYDAYKKDIIGIIEDIELCNSLHFEELFRSTFVANLPQNLHEQQYISLPQAKRMLTSSSVAAVFDTYEDYLQISKLLDFSEFFLTFFVSRQIYDRCVIISPFADFNYSAYQNVVVFQSNSGISRFYCDRAVYIKLFNNNILDGLTLNRDDCVCVYNVLKKKSSHESLKTAYDKYLTGKISHLQYLTALKVFYELEFISNDSKNQLIFNEKAKTALEQSHIYRRMQEAKKQEE